MTENEHMAIIAKEFFANLNKNEHTWAVGLDGKRPFGSSNPAYDILPLLTDMKPEFKDEDGDLIWSDKQIDYANRLFYNLVPYLKRVYSDHGMKTCSSIKDSLISISGKNVLSGDNKEIASLTKCVNYLITQIRIMDDSEEKTRSSVILDNAHNILSVHK